MTTKKTETKLKLNKNTAKNIKIKTDLKTGAPNSDGRGTSGCNHNQSIRKSKKNK